MVKNYRIKYTSIASVGRSYDAVEITKGEIPEMYVIKIINT